MNVSVKREFSYDESLRKWYQCIANETLIIDEENDVKISPGQIVKIQREKTINSWPMVFIDDVDYDIAICDEFFDDFFEEFDIKKNDLKIILRKEFRKAMKELNVEFIDCKTSQEEDKVIDAYIYTLQYHIQNDGSLDYTISEYIEMSLDFNEENLIKYKNN